MRRAAEGCTTGRMSRTLVLLLGLGLAGAARAEPPSAALNAAVRPAQIRLAEPYAQAYALKSAGIARTSVDRRIASDAKASLGFLCGLQPGAERSGGAATRG